MKFTDDDLQRLKTLVGRSEEGAFVHLLKPSFDNLIARLEAAEEVIHEFKLQPVPVAVVQRWREVSGK